MKTKRAPNEDCTSLDEKLLDLNLRRLESSATWSRHYGLICCIFTAASFVADGLFDKLACLIIALLWYIGGFVLRRWD